MRCGFIEYISELLSDIPRGVTLLEVQYCYTSVLLRKNKGNKTHTAKELGISLTSIKRRVKEMKHFGYHVEPMKVQFGLPASED